MCLNANALTSGTLTASGNTVLGSSATDTLTVNASASFISGIAVAGGMAVTSGTLTAAGPATVAGEASRPGIRGSYSFKKTTVLSQALFVA